MSSLRENSHKTIWSSCNLHYVRPKRAETHHDLQQCHHVSPTNCYTISYHGIVHGAPAHPRTRSDSNLSRGDKGLKPNSTSARHIQGQINPTPPLNTPVTLKPGDRGSTVVKVLCYKSEGRWFDSRWCHWNFSFT